MEDELDLSGILSSEETDNLFEESIVDDDANSEDLEGNSDGEEVDEIEPIDVESLFEEVDDNASKTNDDKKDKTLDKGKGDVELEEEENGVNTPNIYSSFASSLKTEGVLPDLSDDVIKEIKDADSFIKIIDDTVQGKLTERQQRIESALNTGVEPDQINKFENVLNTLNNIDEATIADEAESGETLRRQLIYQDAVNRGYSKERATREVEKSFTAGTDLEDAKEALVENKIFIQNAYNSVLDKAKEEEAAIIKNREDQAKELKRSILEDKEVFEGLTLDKKTRENIYKNINTPVYQDPNNGAYYTAIQKYEKENHVDFVKKVGLLFTLTDGFKSLDKLITPSVNKEVKKGMKELENALNNTSRNNDGSLKFTGGSKKESDSYFGDGWDI